MDKKGANTLLTIVMIAFLVLVGGYIYNEGWFDKFIGAADVIPEEGAPTGEGPGAGVCAIKGEVMVSGVCTCLKTDTVTTTFNLKNKHIATATFGAETNFSYVKNGGPATEVANAGQKSFSSGDELRVFAAYGSPDYNSRLLEVTVPCAPTFDVYADVVRIGNLTSTLTNGDTGEAMKYASSNASGNLTIGAAQTKWAEVKIVQEAKDGNQNGYRLVCDGNQSAYDDIKCLDSTGGTEYPEGTVPSRLWVLRGGLYEGYAWELPALDSNDELIYRMQLEATSTAANEPEDTPADAVQCAHFDYQWVRTEDGTYVLDVQNPDSKSTNLGAANELAVDQYSIVVS